MNIFKILIKSLFPTDIENVFSEAGKESTALNVAARFTRGNTSIQHHRVTTAQNFDNEIERMKNRVASTSR